MQTRWKLEQAKRREVIASALLQDGLGNAPKATFDLLRELQPQSSVPSLIALVRSGGATVERRLLAAQVLHTLIPGHPVFIETFEGVPNSQLQLTLARYAAAGDSRSRERLLAVLQEPIRTVTSPLSIPHPDPTQVAAMDALAINGYASGDEVFRNVVADESIHFQDFRRNAAAIALRSGDSAVLKRFRDAIRERPDEGRAWLEGVRLAGRETPAPLLDDIGQLVHVSVREWRYLAMAAIRSSRNGRFVHPLNPLAHGFDPLVETVVLALGALDDPGGLASVERGLVLQRIYLDPGRTVDLRINAATSAIATQGPRKPTTHSLVEILTSTHIETPAMRAWAASVLIGNSHRAHLPAVPSSARLAAPYFDKVRDVFKTCSSGALMRDPDSSSVTCNRMNRQNFFS